LRARWKLIDGQTKAQRLQTGKHQRGHSSPHPASPRLAPANGFGAGLGGRGARGSGRTVLCSRGAVSSPPAPFRRGDMGDAEPGSSCLNSPFPASGDRGTYPVPNPAPKKPQPAPKITTKWETGFQPGLIFPGYCLAASSRPRRKPTKHRSCVACYFCLTGIC